MPILGVYMVKSTTGKGASWCKSQISLRNHAILSVCRAISLNHWRLEKKSPGTDCSYTQASLFYCLQLHQQPFVLDASLLSVKPWSMKVTIVVLNVAFLNLPILSCSLIHKAPITTAADNILKLIFYFSGKIRLMFHVNCLSSRQFT